MISWPQVLDHPQSVTGMSTSGGDTGLGHAAPLR